MDMVRRVLVSTALAVGLAIVYFSAPAASEEQDAARVVPMQHCPKPGLCPYVKRLPPPFFHQPTVYAHSPAHYPHYPHYTHYPPLQHYFPIHYAHPHGSGHYEHAHPPSVVPHENPHHGSSTAHAAAPGGADGHHSSPHHVEKRDEAAHHDSKKVEASLCGNLCVNDDICPGQKKCCPTECGYSCFDPVHIAE